MFKSCKCQKENFQYVQDNQIVDETSKSITFQPPKRIWYDIEPLNYRGQCKINRAKHSTSHEKVKFVHEVYNNIFYDWIEEECYIYKKRASRSENKANNLIILHLKNYNKWEDGFTLLFSHGSTSTLGTVYPILYDLSTQLRCDIISYDYSGYGRSQGKASEEEIYSDIEEVWFFVNEILRIPVNHWLLVGHSIGALPALHLATTEGLKDNSAMILLSPVLLGLKHKEESRADENSAISPKIKKIADVQCPIFLVHGQRDDLIPIQQSMEMAKYMKNLYEWYPRKGDHYNILTEYRTKFLQKAKIFFQYLIHFSKRETNYNSISITNQQSSNIHENEVNAQENVVQLEENFMESGKLSIHMEEVERKKANAPQVLTNLTDSYTPLKQLNESILKCSLSSMKKRKMCIDSPIEERNSGKFTNLSQNKDSEKSNEKDSKDYSMIPFNTKELEDEYFSMIKKHNGI